MRTLAVWLMLLCVGLFFLGCQPADKPAPSTHVPAPVMGEEETETEAVEGEEAAEKAPAEGEKAAEEAPAEGEKAPMGEAPAEKPAE